MGDSDGDEGLETKLVFYVTGICRLHSLGEELLTEHFGDIIKLVKTRASDDPSSGPEKPVTVTDVEPLVMDFASSRWEAAIRLMCDSVFQFFSYYSCAEEIVRAALAQLLLYYSRLSCCVVPVCDGSAVYEDLDSVSSIECQINKALVFV
ncbi:hypothetical protein IFM89_004366 [Coptis chinensis]|uniref:Uncharacterized protein n=1 Tax=Coptis chinensis TaxID=261450 RepID=A0A835IML9_9MAGN|nr:hypothetical protein IFM89_004366 [Coptis chinensis]